MVWFGLNRTKLSMVWFGLNRIEFRIVWFGLKNGLVWFSLNC